MKTDELIKALGQLKVQTGSLACLGCQHEDNCGVHGCALLQEATERLNQYSDILVQVAELNEELGKALVQLEKDMRVLVAGAADPCGMCAHCCAAGKPIFRPNEEYMAYCNKCDEDCSEFVWRGHDER